MTAKDDYATELDRLRANLERLNRQLESLVGDGTLSDAIHYAHVGDLKRVNLALEDLPQLRRIR